MPCEVLVKDECNCPLYAAANIQAETQASWQPSRQLLMTCKPRVPTGCGPAPSPGVCIIGDAGSASLACQ